MKQAFSILVAFGLLGSLSGAEKLPARLPSKENFHLYLLMGQSNMAGQGTVGKEDKTPHPRVLVFNRNSVWELSGEPITKDPAGKGRVGPAFSFAKIMVEKNPSITIGLIPCAVGGTSLDRWEKGVSGDLYTNAVARAKSAMKDGTLKGILWHQGESNSNKKHQVQNYGERLAKMIGEIRADLHSPDLPFVVGKLGKFLQAPYAPIVNLALEKIPDVVPFTACVDSTGLHDKGDSVHFDTESQRELGKRYAAAMIQLQGKK